MKFRSLIHGFLESVERFAGRPALVIGRETFTYDALWRRATQVANAILRYEPAPAPLAAVLAQRSATAYSGILGTLAAGKGYVPLNPKFPIERTRRMLALSGCTVLIAGKASAAQLPALLAGIARRMLVILPDLPRREGLHDDLIPHQCVFSEDLPPTGGYPLPLESGPDALAYLLFTSGSTGEPKGVPIRQSNVRPYLDYVGDRYQVTPEDRFSQEFDLTFDLSVHDLFVCWERGACLFCVPEEAVMAPAKFIRDCKLTVWFSVPSVIGVLARLRLLSPGCFPGLRCSLFCGEPLPAGYAERWQQAAPNSLVENLYGPTEATIAISRYCWDPRRSPEECRNGIVPIGWVFDGQKAGVIDPERRIVPAGEPGELCLSGSQVASGYWNAPQRTQERFIRLHDVGDSVWYRTGDRVLQDASGCLHYLGRTDHQVKIRGYRVELQEVEAVLRQLCRNEHVVSVPWPVCDGRAEGIVAFVAGEPAMDPKSILDRCSEVLPGYMVPRKICWLETLPLNANGKVDRAALVGRLEGTQL